MNARTEKELDESRQWAAEYSTQVEQRDAFMLGVLKARLEKAHDEIDKLKRELRRDGVVL